MNYIIIELYKQILLSHHIRVRELKLAKNGWKVLRIKWVDMFHEPKKYIKIAKDFIEK